VRIQPTLRKMKAWGVRAILDYAAGEWCGRPHARGAAARSRRAAGRRQGGAAGRAGDLTGARAGLRTSRPAASPSPAAAGAPLISLWGACCIAALPVHPGSYPHSHGSA
jgi:hypothetical protein